MIFSREERSGVEMAVVHSEQDGADICRLTSSPPTTSDDDEEFVLLFLPPAESSPPPPARVSDAPPLTGVPCSAGTGVSAGAPPPAPGAAVLPHSSPLASFFPAPCNIFSRSIAAVAATASRTFIVAVGPHRPSWSSSSVGHTDKFSMVDRARIRYTEKSSQNPNFARNFLFIRGNSMKFAGSESQAFVRGSGGRGAAAADGGGGGTTFWEKSSR